MYIVLSIIAALIGGTMSWIIRLELAEPGMQFIDDNQLYNVMVTAHGLLMIFFVVMPGLIGGFGNWFVPLMIGAPDMAFPRMNNISFWLLAAALVLLIMAGLTGGGPGTGWTSIRRSVRQPSIRRRPSTWRSSACTWPAPRRSSARSTLSPPSSTCAHPA